MQAWRGAPPASGEPLELAEELRWGRKSRTVWWEDDMAGDGIYIRGNNKRLGAVWAAEGKRVAGESMGVCRRLGWPSGGLSLVCGVEPWEIEAAKPLIPFQQISCHNDLIYCILVFSFCIF
jgi:hypothetical protein